MLTTTITSALQEVWVNILSSIPALVSALLVLVIGLLLASFVGNVVTRITRAIKIDELVSRAGLTEHLTRMGVTFSLANFLGWLVKWFVIIVSLIAVADILNWPQITMFLQQVALYVPHVLIAVVILMVGLVVGQFIFNLVEKSIQVSRIPTSAARPVAAVAKWAIIVFAFMAALTQLGIAAKLIEIIFTGLVAMLALAGGLAFGLGGKEHANRWLSSIEKELSRRE